MHTIVDISMYPLREDYASPIKAFIARLQAHGDVSVATGPTATRIEGEYEAVMACLREAMAWSRGEHGKAVFVTKIIPGYTPGED